MSSEAPRPSYSCGMVSPNRPSFLRPDTIWAGYSSRCSSSVATGMISLAVKSRTVARMSCSNSVRPSVCARRPMASSFGSAGRLGAAGLSAAAFLDVGLRGHHDLAAEHAHQGSVLLVAAGLDLDDAPVAGRGEPLAEHGGLAVDGVAVEGRCHVLERLDFQVGDGLAGDVRYRHAEQQRVDVVAHHHVLAEIGGTGGVVRVQVERVVVDGEETEQVIVVLGDRLLGTVLVDLSDLELFIRPSELHSAHSPAGCGGSNLEVRCMPAARPLAATTRAILREASSIISSPSMADPLAPPASEVHQS